MRRLIFALIRWWLRHPGAWPEPPDGRFRDLYSAARTSEGIDDPERMRARAQMAAPFQEAWFAWEDSWTFTLHCGNRQILKAPKTLTPYAEYWPNAAERGYMLLALNQYPLLLQAHQDLVLAHSRLEQRVETLSEWIEETDWDEDDAEALEEIGL